MKHKGFAQVEPTDFPVIASTCWEHVGGKVMYIEDTCHRKGTAKARKFGVDWGYTDRPEKAIPLSRYWWRRFRHDMHYCGHCAHFGQPTTTPDSREKGK